MSLGSKIPNLQLGMPRGISDESDEPDTYQGWKKVELLGSMISILLYRDRPMTDWSPLCPRFCEWSSIKFQPIFHMMHVTSAHRHTLTESASIRKYPKVYKRHKGHNTNIGGTMANQRTTPSRDGTSRNSRIKSISAKPYAKKSRPYNTRTNANTKWRVYGLPSIGTPMSPLVD